MISQEITVSEYTIKSFADMKKKLDVSSVQLSKAIAALGTLDYSVK